MCSFISSRERREGVAGRNGATAWSNANDSGHWVVRAREVMVGWLLKLESRQQFDRAILLDAPTALWELCLRNQFLNRGTDEAARDFLDGVAEGALRGQ